MKVLGEVEDDVVDVVVVCEMEARKKIVGEGTNMRVGEL